MILSDQDIRTALEQDRIGVDPYRESTMLQPNSVDLRLSYEFVYKDEDTGWEDYTVKLGDPHYTLLPGEFCLASTLETVSIENTLTAMVRGRSSVGRKGVMVECAGVVDAGFSGQITLELKNLTDEPVSLQPGMRICQLTFHQLSSPSEEPYGVKADSKYQGQSGPTQSCLSQDSEFQ